MPNIMNMQALGGMSQNVPIVMPGYVGGGTAANVDSGQLQAQLRRAFGVDLPPTIDVTMLLSPALPAAIMPASAFTTPVFKSCGASQVAAALTLSQGGNVVLNRFLDPIGAILSTSATQAATANAQCLLDFRHHFTVPKLEPGGDQHGSEWRHVVELQCGARQVSSLTSKKIVHQTTNRQSYGDACQAAAWQKTMEKKRKTKDAKRLAEQQVPKRL